MLEDKALLITVPWRFALPAIDPASHRHAGGISHGGEAEDHQEKIGGALPEAGGDGAEVHQRLWNKWSVRMAVR